jgi:hypothetical protein
MQDFIWTACPDSTCSYGKKYVQLSKIRVSRNNKRSQNFSHIHILHISHILHFSHISHLFAPLSVVVLVNNLQVQITLQSTRTDPKTLCGQEIKLGMQNGPKTMPTLGALPLTVPSLFGVAHKMKAQALAMQAIISIWSKPSQG